MQISSIDNGWLWFHWLGAIYGWALLDLLRYTLPAEETPQPGLCLLLAEKPTCLPTWSAEQVVVYLHDQYRRYESLLALGAYHHLLPSNLRRRAVIEQFDVPRFMQAIRPLHPERTTENHAKILSELIPLGS
jgi:hypothetical protein